MQRVREDGVDTVLARRDAGAARFYGPGFQMAYELRKPARRTANSRVQADARRRPVAAHLTMLFETATRGSRSRSLQHPLAATALRVVHSSNLCTEITLNTSDDEVAVCISARSILSTTSRRRPPTRDRLARTVATAMRMLDNVLDVNLTPSEARPLPTCGTVRGSRHHGLQDALQIQRIPMASNAGGCIRCQSMEAIGNICRS